MGIVKNKIRNLLYTKDGEIGNEINKQLVVIIVSIFITVVTVIGVTYSAFVWSDNSEKNQNIVSGNVVLSISSDSGELGSGLDFPVLKENESLLEPYTFTIKNDGDLPSVYKIKIADDSSYNNTLNKEYIFMSLTTSDDNIISRNSIKIYNDMSIDTGILGPGESKTYDLRLWIVEDAPNSVIGNEWHGKILLESSQTIEWVDDEKLLTDALFKNNEVITQSPNFESNTDKGLFVQQGDNTKSIDGNPTYYFRGPVENNYVSFANNIWRIVRINEDGSIKLVLEGGILTSSFGASGSNAGYVGSDAETQVNNFYNSHLSGYTDYIVSHNFENVNGSLLAHQYIIAYYPNPTFVPKSEYTLTANVGMLSVFEAQFAGGEISYLNSIRKSLLMSSSLGAMWHVDSIYGRGPKITNDLGNVVDYYARPVINLNANTVISTGNGTKVYPYVVK